MASVTYNCKLCGNFWFRGSGYECPECKSTNVVTDWDEQYDEKDTDNINDCYDQLSEPEDQREMLLGVFR